MMAKDNNILFEVFRYGQRLFFTEDKSCIYPDTQIKDMIKDGYTFKLNGKVYKPKKGS